MLAKFGSFNIKAADPRMRKIGVLVGVGALELLCETWQNTRISKVVGKLDKN